MDSIKKLLRSKLIIEYINKKLNRTFINESTLTSKTIINVDIQPEYKDYISFNLHEWVNFINQNAELNNIVFLYNGADTLGMIDEQSFKEWLFELGIDEDVIYNAMFYDKGYAFFRYCMDSNINEEAIVKLIKFMIKYNINDSREINKRFWNQFIKEHQDDDYSSGELRDLLENAGDAINIPDLMDFIKNYSNIVLLGGGINQCLKEVELALLALDKQYTLLKQYTY